MNNFDITQIVSITGLGGLALIVLLYLFRDLIKGVLKDLFPKFDKNQAFMFLVLLMFVIFAVVVFAIFSNVRQNQVANTNATQPNNSPPPIASPSPTPSNTPPINFAGKFGIPLESDEKLEWAVTNVQTKGKDKGFEEVYIFKDAGYYKTVAIFNDAATAQENLSLAKSVNPTANEVKSFKTWCSNPKWVKDDGYYNCSK